MKEFDELIDVMHRLRSECPWDREQNLKSLRSYLLEEAYECVDALDQVEKDGTAPLIEELGDVLLQVVFQSEILSEQLKREVIRDVLKNLVEKLIRRHPHVFGDQKISDPSKALDQWNEIKKKEKGDQKKSAFSDLPKALTAIQRAQKIGAKSKKLAFDWTSTADVKRQIESEEEELSQAKTLDEKHHELGDVLFSWVQWARHEGIDSEVALHSANTRFLSRFQKMLELKQIDESSFKDLSSEEKESLWKQAKLALR